MVVWAWGPGARVERHALRVGNTPSVADAPWHVGVARQRPEVVLLVVVERRLVAQAGVGRVRVLVDLVVVGVVHGSGDAHALPFRSRRRPVQPVGHLGVGQQPIPPCSSAPESASTSVSTTAGSASSPSATVNRSMNSAADLDPQPLHVGVGARATPTSRPRPARATPRATGSSAASRSAPARAGCCRPARRHAARRGGARRARRTGGSWRPGRCTPWPARPGRGWRRCGSSGRRARPRAARRRRP